MGGAGISNDWCISEQLDSRYIDTRQKKERNKISGNYYLSVFFYIVNDEIQYYLIVRLISVDKVVNKPCQW